MDIISVVVFPLLDKTHFICYRTKVVVSSTETMWMICVRENFENLILYYNGILKPSDEKTPLVRTSDTYETTILESHWA